MKTQFLEPSHNYNIVLNRDDVIELLTKGSIMYMPNHINHSDRGRYSGGCYLFHQGSDDNNLHIQYVMICLEGFKRDKSSKV